MKKVMIVLALTILLASLAAASTSCPCSRPGKPGTLIGFDARNGTTDNVTFYNDTSPQLGKAFSVWALKKIGINEVPINELIINVTLDSQVINVLRTDRDGQITLLLEKPGEYLLAGGDAEMSFELKGEEPQEEITPNGSATLNDSTTLNDSATQAQSAGQQEKSTQTVALTPQPSGGDVWPYAALIAVAAVGLISIKTGIYRRCFPVRRSSAISGKRRG